MRSVSVVLRQGFSFPGIMRSVSVESSTGISLPRDHVQCLWYLRQGFFFLGDHVECPNRIEANIMPRGCNAASLKQGEAATEMQRWSL
jgi:hypothetical protein